MCWVLIATSQCQCSPQYEWCACARKRTNKNVILANENTIAMDVLDYHKNVITRSKSDILKSKKRGGESEPGEQTTNGQPPILVGCKAREALQSCLWVYILFLIHLMPSYTLNVYDFMCCRGFFLSPDSLTLCRFRLHLAVVLLLLLLCVCQNFCPFISFIPAGLTVLQPKNSHPKSMFRIALNNNVSGYSYNGSNKVKQIENNG